MGILDRIGNLLGARKRAAEEFEQARQRAVEQSAKINALSMDEAKRLAEKILARDDVVTTVAGTAAAPDSRLARGIGELFSKYQEISFGEMSLLLNSAYLDYDPPIPGMIVIGQNIDAQHVCVRPHEEAVHYVWSFARKVKDYRPETDRTVYHAILSAGLDSGELPEDLQNEIEEILEHAST